MQRFIFWNQLGLELIIIRLFCFPISWTDKKADHLIAVMVKQVSFKRGSVRLVHLEALTLCEVLKLPLQAPTDLTAHHDVK